MDRPGAIISVRADHGDGCVLVQYVTSQSPLGRVYLELVSGFVVRRTFDGGSLEQLDHSDGDDVGLCFFRHDGSLDATPLSV